MTPPLTRDEMAAKLQQESPRFAELPAATQAQYLDNCMAEQDRDVREPWRTLTFDRTTEARGRNGWFVLNDGRLDVFPTRAYLPLNAKQHGKNSPIALEFGAVSDLRRLGQALTQAAEAWETLITQEHSDAHV